jgi:glycosyltransferase involved in cell wall biosynthesis
MSGPPPTLFITTDAVGGVWSYSVALARGMSRLGWRCVLAVLGPPPSVAQCHEIAGLAGCAVHLTQLPLEWTLSGRPELDRLTTELAAQAGEQRATTVHLHAPSLAACAWRVPVVAVAHSCMATWWDAVRGGPRPEAIAWHAAATAQGLRSAEGVIAPSRAFANDLVLAYEIGRSITVVPNGLEDPVAGSVPRGGFVLAAGRLWDEAKNIASLDGAAGAMRTPVHVAGPLHAPGAANVSFTNLVHLGNLAPPALQGAMARAAIFASPARYEPFGLAVLEAAQHATPLVLADIPTFRELWSGAAIFLPPGDTRAWASCLDRLAQDSPRRAALGRAARIRARHYTVAAMVSATAAIHHHIGGTARRAA